MPKVAHRSAPPKPKNKRRGKGQGCLYQKRPGGPWYGKYVATVDGERIRQTACLRTTNRQAAQAKLKRLIDNNVTDLDVKRTELFRHAAERVRDARVALGKRSAPDDYARLSTYAFDAIGDVPVGEIKAEQVNEVLDHARDEGLSKQTVIHLRNSIRHVFKTLCREKAVAANPVDESALPDFPQEIKRTRAVLEDAELLMYLSYEPPKGARNRDGVLELQMMVLMSRCLGGMRAGDLHALDWEAFEVDDARFSWAWVPRKKTGTPQKLAVPEVLRKALRRWWDKHGRPAAGPVFPVRRGPRAGTRKGPSNHAKALRRDLKRAFAQARKRGCEGVPKSGSARWRELFEGTAQTLPVDFHSTRRAFCQALMTANVNAQQALQLAGHGSFDVHTRYTADPNAPAVMPEQALPTIPLPPLLASGDPDDDPDSGSGAPPDSSPGGTYGGDSGGETGDLCGGVNRADPAIPALRAIPGTSQAGSRGFKSRIPLREPPEKSGGSRVWGGGHDPAIVPPDRSPDPKCRSAARSDTEKTDRPVVKCSVQDLPAVLAALDGAAVEIVVTGADLAHTRRPGGIVVDDDDRGEVG